MMKQLLVYVCLLFAITVQAQKETPLINANSNQATIIEDGVLTAWTLDPNIKRDIYTTARITKTKKVVFKTDVDSLVVLLDAGMTKDFVVVLNHKDSCRTRIESPANKDLSSILPEIHDTIPVILNEQNTVYVKGLLNDTDTLDLNFDSGTTELILTNDVLKNKIRSRLQLYNTYYDLKIGKRTYKIQVFPAALTGHGTDGRFGWDLFDGLIVELDYDRNRMIVHSKMPEHISRDKQLSKLKIRYFKTIFLIEGSIIQGKKEVKDWFLFDSGYQRTAMLDNDLLRQENFPVEGMKVIKKVMMHGAQGNEVPVITSNLEKLKLGKYELDNVPVQVLEGNKPMEGATMHILGNEVLKRFNIVMDFQHNLIYLKPNTLFHTTYVEQSRK